MQLLDQTLGALARRIVPGAIRAFLRYAVDACCNGHEAFRDAARRKQLSNKPLFAGMPAPEVRHG